MILQNALVYTPRHTFERGTIVIRDGRIVPFAAPEEGEEVLDAEGLYALPGLVDIHFHGAMGKDFCDGTEEAIQTLADFEASKGVLAICPATMTYPEEFLNKVMDAAAAHKNGKGADLVGINMEGPFISPKKVGAQNPEYVQGADAAMFRRLQKRANGLIKLVDVAPEEPGNLDFIRECHNEVRISIAHTCTDYDTAVKAFEAGATHMTHLYNAMPGITHRAPGPIIAAMEHDAEVELITDNVHIHPAMVRFTFNTFGDDRVCLIADSHVLRPAGRPVQSGRTGHHGQGTPRHPDRAPGHHCGQQHLSVRLHEACRAGDERAAGKRRPRRQRDPRQEHWRGQRLRQPCRRTLRQRDPCGQGAEHQGCHPERKPDRMREPAFIWRLLTGPELTDVYLNEMRRDFPAGELKPLSMILNSEADGTAHTWGVFDGDTLAAYLLMVRPEGCRMSQLDYFAVVPAYRAHGIGAQLLAQLPAHEDTAEAILIEAEMPEKAEDAAMAVRRLGFYARCGAWDTHYTEHLFDAWFRILVLDCPGCAPLAPETAVEALTDCYRRTISPTQWQKHVQFFAPDGSVCG